MLFQVPKLYAQDWNFKQGFVLTYLANLRMFEYMLNDTLHL